MVKIWNIFMSYYFWSGSYAKKRTIKTSKYILVFYSENKIAKTYLLSWPILRPAPCSTNLVKFVISCFKAWMVSLARVSFSCAASTIFQAFSISWGKQKKGHAPLLSIITNKLVSLLYNSQCKINEIGLEGLTRGHSQIDVKCYLRIRITVYLF